MSLWKSMSSSCRITFPVVFSLFNFLFYFIPENILVKPWLSIFFNFIFVWCSAFSLPKKNFLPLLSITEGTVQFLVGSCQKIINISSTLMKRNFTKDVFLVNNLNVKRSYFRLQHVSVLMVMLLIFTVSNY